MSICITDRTPGIPTPLNALQTPAEDALVVEGHQIEMDDENNRRTQAKNDAKRYLKLFTKHLTHYNSGYTVVSTRTDITINRNGDIFCGPYAYKAGHVKGMYCVLRLAGNRAETFKTNMVNFVPFLDYTSVTTPEPDSFFGCVQKLRA